LELTHEELLAKIDSLSCCSGAHELALRAVVELHKAYQPYKGMTTIYCAVCHESGSNWGEHWYPVAYPCKTIQAIQKELQ